MVFIYTYVNVNVNVIPIHTVAYVCFKVTVVTEHTLSLSKRNGLIT